MRDKEPFSHLDNSPIAQCASQTFTTGHGRNKRKRKLPQDKQKLFVAEYYNTKHRLESGLTQQLQDIAAIDNLIGEPLLDDTTCNSFKRVAGSFHSQCDALKKCSSSSTEPLTQSAKDTALAMKAIAAIDQEIDNLKQKEDEMDAEKLQQQISELEGKKQNLQSLYPWMMGRILSKRL